MYTPPTMSHQAQIDFVAQVKAKYPDFFSNKKVLEVGSLNINGSIREFFTGCDYLGVDLGPGRDVDMVCPGELLDFADGEFDVACSCECFEHNPKWLETFVNMVRMSRGLVFFSCATIGRPEHGTPRTSPTDAPYCGDYYKNLAEQDFRELDLDSLFVDYAFSTNDHTHDLYFWGVKNAV